MLATQELRRFGLAIHWVGWILFLLAMTVLFHTPSRRPLSVVGLSLWGVGLTMRTMASRRDAKAKISDEKQSAEQTAQLEK